MKTICDWPQCMRVASVEVRRDVPRGDTFQTYIWHRCGDHDPEELNRR